MSAPKPTVAVIGAGFSGAAVVANLLRLRVPMHVVLVNRFGRPGRGVAYGTRFEAHLLNVPAGQMSIYPDDPERFVRFARNREPDLAATSFVPRRLYGEYLEYALQEAIEGAVAGATVETIVAEASRIELHRNDPKATVTLRDASPVSADRVVLALGNYSPANPPIDNPAFYLSERYIRDPWVPGALGAIGPRERVLILGTGLTMMDIALDLGDRGLARPIHAVSPRALLPRRHAAAPAQSSLEPLVPDGREARIARHLRTFREWLAEHVEAGIDWREVIGSIRAATPRIWQGLPVAERARFLRHVRPYWDAHRHRAPAATADAIATMRAAGALQITAGRVREYEPGEAGVRVSIRRRGSERCDVVEVDRVVNCTGPDTDVRRIEDPLLRSLVDDGHVLPDPLGLGLQTNEDGMVLDRGGQPSHVLALVGPLLKSGFWECTAVPELRERAASFTRQFAAPPLRASARA